jgi:hypothetical protein
VEVPVEGHKVYHMNELLDQTRQRSSQNLVGNNHHSGHKLLLAMYGLGTLLVCISLFPPTSDLVSIIMPTVQMGKLRLSKVH